MSHTLTLEKHAWSSYFDLVSKEIAGEQADIEVNGLDIGAQVETRWVPLSGISYDRRSDLVQVQAGSVDHVIREPMDIAVELDCGALKTVSIVDAGGHRQLVRFRRPLGLPAARSATGEPT